MPIPKRDKGEKTEDFINRCMSNETMNNDYPDNKQRAGVCYAQLDMLEEIEPSENIQKVLTIPKGKFYVDKYGREVVFDDKTINEIYLNLKNPNLFQPFVDKNHEYKEAYAEIVGGEIAPLGLYTYWKLNDKGKELIKNKEYRYISPTIDTIKDNNGNEHKNVLMTVTLTNIPALLGTLPQLSEQLALEASLKATLEKNNNGGKMTELNLKLGLEPEASKESTLTAFNKKMIELETVKKENETVKIELGTIKSENEKNKMLMMELNKTANELQEKIKKIELEGMEDEADAFIEALLNQNMIHPKLADFIKQEYIKDPEKIKGMFEGVEMQKKEMTFKDTPRKQGLNIELSQDEIKALKLSGADDEAIEIYKQRKGGL